MSQVPYYLYITVNVLFVGEARLDAILIHGVDDMSTKDVFAYFNDFAPGSVEWIDDSSCKSLQNLPCKQSPFFFEDQRGLCSQCVQISNVLC